MEIAQTENIYEVSINELDNLFELVQDQAKNEELWFKAETAPEEVLQKALRELHNEIEQLYKHADIIENDL